MQLETRSAAECSLDELIALLQRGFEDYMVPLAFDEAGLSKIIVADDIDLGSSVVFVVDGFSAGVALIARRPPRCRLAAMGVVKRARGQGLGKRVMPHLLQAAADRGDTEFVLEVIASNTPALNLYEGAGFVRKRSLLGFEAPAVKGIDVGDTAGIPQPLDADWAVDFVQQHADPDLSWQLDPRNLSSLDDLSYFRVGEAVGWMAPSEHGALLGGLVVHRDHRRQGEGSRWLDWVRAGFGHDWKVRAIVPDRYEDFFLRNGFKRGPLFQYEMVLQS